MDKIMTMDNPYFWAALSGACMQIVNLTAPGDCCPIPAEVLELFDELGKMSGRDMCLLAQAMMDEKKRKEAQARA